MGDEIKIVVLDRGWVFVGRTRVVDQTVRIEQAKCIRRWGTERGLGELTGGPRSDTILDAAGTVEAPVRALIFTLDVEQDAWTRALNS